MRLYAFTIAAVCLLTAAEQESQKELHPQYEQTKQVIGLVRKAAALVSQKGEDAFPEFKNKGSQWFEGDAYVFVFDLKGTSLCHPLLPETEGENTTNLTDSDGKPMVAMMIDKVSGKKAAGWVHYKWPSQRDGRSAWKSSYCMRVRDASGKEYVVGSGLYDMKVEKLFVVETVDAAAKLVKKQGRQAFATLRDGAGPFRYQDIYVFVHDQNGTELVNPGSPDIEGTNLIDLKDVNGKFITRGTLKMLETKEAGWIDYMWPKPGESRPSKKLSYIRKVPVGDETLYVGAGVYLD